MSDICMTNPVSVLMCMEVGSVLPGRVSIRNLLNLRRMHTRCSLSEEGAALGTEVSRCLCHVIRMSLWDPTWMLVCIDNVCVHLCAHLHMYSDFLCLREFPGRVQKMCFPAWSLQLVGVGFGSVWYEGSVFQFPCGSIVNMPRGWLLEAYSVSESLNISTSQTLVAVGF